VRFALPANRAPIDGGAVVLRNDGRSDFLALLTKRGDLQATLVAFDLGRREGEDHRERIVDAKHFSGRAHGFGQQRQENAAAAANIDY
jgi:hypothetical protein